MLGAVADIRCHHDTKGRPIMPSTPVLASPPRQSRDLSPERLAQIQEAEGLLASAIDALDVQGYTGTLETVCADEAEAKLFARLINQAGVKYDRVTRCRIVDGNVLYFRVKEAGAERQTRTTEAKAQLTVGNSDAQAEIDATPRGRRRK